jgi:hypothetical protein
MNKFKQYHAQTNWVASKLQPSNNPSIQCVHCHGKGHCDCPDYEREALKGLESVPGHEYQSV